MVTKQSNNLFARIGLFWKYWWIFYSIDIDISGVCFIGVKSSEVNLWPVRKTLQKPVWDYSCLKPKSTINKNKKRSYAQFHLDLGQSDFTLRSCSACGVKSLLERKRMRRLTRHFIRSIPMVFHLRYTTKSCVSKCAYLVWNILGMFEYYASCFCTLYVESIQTVMSLKGCMFHICLISIVLVLYLSYCFFNFTGLVQWKGDSNAACPILKGVKSFWCWIVTLLHIGTRFLFDFWFFEIGE